MSMHVFYPRNGHSNSPRVHLKEGLDEGGHFGVGKHGVTKSLQSGLVVEVDADEHELGAGRNPIGRPQGGRHDL